MARPFAVQRIDHDVLRVGDLDRSEAFYRELLGCEVARRRDDHGLRHMRAGASMIDLVSVDGKLGSRGGAAPGADARNVDHLCLRIEPFDEAAILDHLAAHGIAPHAPASENFGAEGEGPSLYLDDPDGNTLELKGPAA
jgi:catechol 2,3-dioxygenase-like lactoylglutathione lyase family enzyme